MWKICAAAVLILLLNDWVIWYFQRRKQQKELQMISDAIAGVLEGKGAESCLELADSQPAKIRHQLNQLVLVQEGKQNRLERERDEIRKMIAEIAHQLRTPLANIETYLELLAQAESLQESGRYVRAIGTAEKRIHFLVESFIKMSRLEGGIIQIRKQNTDLTVTLKEAIEQVRKKAEERDIEICQEFEKGLQVAHDRNWLEEAVGNLLDNAVKYSPTGNRVVIGASKSELSVRIWVRDFGETLPDGEENKVFQRFFRGSNVNGQEGFGLGLYLTREIVIRHSGFVKYRKMQDGNCFEIYLPHSGIPAVKQQGCQVK